MTRPLSDDLRRRVAANRLLSTQTTRRRQALAPDRGTSRDGPGAGRRDPGHDTGGDRGPSGERAWAAGVPKHGVALLPPPGDHLQITAHASEQQRPDVLQRRRAWFEAQPALDPERLVFVDETGASTKMARRCGRAPRGHRCRAPVPHGHWKTTTFVGALRLSGMTAPIHGAQRRHARRRLPRLRRTGAGADA